MTDVTNFILLGHQRCGSNLLVRAFFEHPQIRMFGEILADDERIRTKAWEMVGRKHPDPDRGDGYQLGQDGAEFLRSKVFSDKPIWNSQAFGFKFFFDHAHFDEASETAWPYLFAHREIRIIHLIRRNLLYALISREVAERTQTWHHLIENKESAPPLPPFAISPATCKTYFDQITEWRRSTLQSLAGHPVLTIEYEEHLCADFRATTLRIFDFLDVIPWRLKPGLVKQQKLTAAQQLSNFSELQRYFRDTPYADFFIDAASTKGIQPARVQPRSFHSNSTLGSKYGPPPGN